MNSHKYCRDCGELRPVTEFSSDRRRVDGLSFYCKLHARRRLLASKDARRGAPQRRHPRQVFVPDGHKWCPDCSTVKPVEEFPLTRRGQARYTYCKPCHNIRGKPSKERVGGSRTYHLKRRYGITAEVADVMLADQGGLCGLCRMAPAAHVDHDHATGAVRDLLCFNCNGGLGQFRDDPALLRAAARYVEAHRAGQAADGRALGALSRPESPPVGSSQRPPRGSTAGRQTRRTSTDGRRTAAGEADG
ncbi:endonuclease [Modestobacter roseus]|nr:endonuclease [Modestobacter roseus]